ncbi:MAG TPA: hypothetical protein VH092_19185 [Urbifossiella sp.]|nr:hypothetical protein [Urbifossiella sp.]
MPGFISNVRPSMFRCQPVSGSSIVFRSHSWAAWSCRRPIPPAPR